MNNKDRKNVERILEHAQTILDETKILSTAEDFKNNNDKSKVALFDLLQIGELANNLSANFVEETSDISWNNIYNLRNCIVHGYASVDYEIIWETIEDNIPVLIKKLTKVLK